MTKKGVSLAGHSFIILTRTDGKRRSLGKYPTLKPFKTRISDDDQICPGSVTHRWEISPETYDAIARDFGQDGFYWLLGNNCCDAVSRVMSKHVGVNLENTKVLGITNPTSTMESVCRIK